MKDNHGNYTCDAHDGKTKCGLAARWDVRISGVKGHLCNRHKQKMVKAKMKIEIVNDLSTGDGPMGLKELFKF